MRVKCNFSVCKNEELTAKWGRAQAVDKLLPANSGVASLPRAAFSHCCLLLGHLFPFTPILWVFFSLSSLLPFQISFLLPFVSVSIPSFALRNCLPSYFQGSTNLPGSFPLTLAVLIQGPFWTRSENSSRLSQGLHVFVVQVQEQPSTALRCSRRQWPGT